MSTGELLLLLFIIIIKLSGVHLFSSVYHSSHYGRNMIPLQSQFPVTDWNKIEMGGESIFDYKMYISYLCGDYRHWILLSFKAWPREGYMGFTDGRSSDRQDSWGMLKNSAIRQWERHDLPGVNVPKKN